MNQFIYCDVLNTNLWYSWKNYHWIINIIIIFSLGCIFWLEYFNKIEKNLINILNEINQIIKIKPVTFIFILYINILWFKLICIYIILFILLNLLILLLYIYILKIFKWDKIISLDTNTKLFFFSIPFAIIYNFKNYKIEFKLIALLMFVYITKLYLLPLKISIFLTKKLDILYILEKKNCKWLQLKVELRNIKFHSTNYFDKILIFYHQSKIIVKNGKILFNPYDPVFERTIQKIGEKCFNYISTKLTSHNNELKIFIINKTPHICEKVVGAPLTHFYKIHTSQPLVKVANELWPNYKITENQFILYSSVESKVIKDIQEKNLELLQKTKTVEKIAGNLTHDLFYVDKQLNVLNQGPYDKSVTLIKSNEYHTVLSLLNINQTQGAKSGGFNVEESKIVDTIKFSLDQIISSNINLDAKVNTLHSYYKNIAGEENAAMFMNMFTKDVRESLVLPFSKGNMIPHEAYYMLSQNAELLSHSSHEELQKIGLELKNLLKDKISF